MAYQVVLHDEYRPTKTKPKRRVWRLQWRLENGMRRYQVIGEVGKLVKRDAERLRHDKEVALNAGTVRADKPESILLSAFLDEDRKRLAVYNKPSSVTTHVRSSRKILSILGEGVKLADVSKASVERIKQAIRPETGRQLSLAYLNGTLGTMRAAFNRAMEIGRAHV